MAINPSGPKDVGQEYRQRRLAEERARELDRVEERYKNEVTQTETTRANQVARMRQSQMDEIERVRNDSAYKITMANQAAEGQLREFQHDTAKLTTEASKRFHEKASALAETERSLQNQQNQLKSRYSAALSGMKHDIEANQELAREKSGRELATLNSQFDRRLTEVEKQGSTKLTRTEQDYRDKVQQAEYEGANTLAMLRQNNTRLSEGMQAEGRIEQAREVEAAENRKQTFEDNYLRQEAEGTKQIEALRQRQKDVMQKLAYSGEREQRRLQHHNQMELYHQTRDIEKRRADIKSSNDSQLYQIQKSFDESKNRAEKTHFKRMSDMQAAQDKLSSDAAVQGEAQKEKINTDYLMQSRTLRDKRQATLTGVAEQISKDLEALTTKGSELYEKAKTEAAIPLTEHNNKQSDAFYRLHQISPNITENQTHVVITVAVPEHEKDSIKIIETSGNKGVTITGNRRFENRAQLSPGQNITTNSFQSYSQSVPLATAVNLRQAVRTYENGILTFNIPKV